MKAKTPFFQVCLFTALGLLVGCQSEVGQSKKSAAESAPVLSGVVSPIKPFTAAATAGTNSTPAPISSGNSTVSGAPIREDGTGPNGWCGFYGLNSGIRTSFGLKPVSGTNWEQATLSVPCQGQSLAVGCPSGFTKFSFGTFSGSDDNSTDWFSTCIKEASIATSTGQPLPAQGVFCGASVLNSGSRASVSVNGDFQNTEIPCQGKKPYSEGCPAGYTPGYWKAVAWADDSSADLVYTCVRHLGEGLQSPIDRRGSFCGLAFSNQGNRASISKGGVLSPSGSIPCEGQNIATVGCPLNYRALTTAVRAWGDDNTADYFTTCLFDPPSQGVTPSPSATPSVSKGIPPSGWCGLSALNAGNHTSIGISPLAGQVWDVPRFSIPCQGQDVTSSCPAGFSQVQFGTFAWSSDNNADSWTTCVKDASEAVNSTPGNQGALCGASVRNSGSFYSFRVEGSESNTDLTCQGKNVFTEGCPTGYRKTYFQAVASSYDSSADALYSCIKEGSAPDPQGSTDERGAFCGLMISNQGNRSSVSVKSGSVAGLVPYFSIPCRGNEIRSKGCPANYKLLSWNVRAWSDDTLSDSVATCVQVAPSTVPPVVPTPCRPPRHYQYVINAAQARQLTGCGVADTDVFKIDIPDEGFALARATVNLFNSHTSQTYYWNLYATVGEAKVSYGVGDDVCPLYVPRPKTVLGYGKLTAANHTVKLSGRQGANPCGSGYVQVTGGSVLDIWVEDPSPQCAQQDINLISSYDAFGSSSFQNFYYWNTYMSPILSLPIPQSNVSTRSKIAVMGVVEGSPVSDPNKTCGSESASLVSQIQANGAGVLSTDSNVIPASQGQGHLVLSNSAIIPYSSQVTSITHTIGSNTSMTNVTTNGCCGDAKLGFVKMP